MQRAFLFLERRSVSYFYLDSVHGALVNGFKAAGLAPALFIGPEARPWTFATKGYAQSGGQLFLKGITISTSDAEIANALLRLDPSEIRHSSSNGDEIDMNGAVKKVVPDPICMGQDTFSICFASPFLLSRARAAANPEKSYADSLTGVDLSAAFSAGLTRRLGRDVALDVQIDPLSAAVSGRPRLVSLRKAAKRRVVVPAFSTMLTLRGNTEDLRLAYYAGLGEKTHYGFGCPAALN